MHGKARLQTHTTDKNKVTQVTTFNNLVIVEAQTKEWQMVIIGTIIIVHVYTREREDCVDKQKNETREKGNTHFHVQKMIICYQLPTKLSYQFIFL